MSTDHISPHGRAALSYAQRFEFAVFPVHGIAIDRGCACRHPDCEHPGKHPCTARGFKDATRETAVIENWWGRWPKANVGIATGAVSGIIVLDVDPRHDGDVSLNALESKNGKLSATVECLTGGGGRHLYLRHPGGIIACSAGRLGPGLDVKADGGYVIAPPSQHCSGRMYEWELSSRVDEIPIAPMPGWLLELIRKPLSRGQSNHQPSEWVELIRRPITEGSRNDTLARLAGHLLRIRVLDPAIAAELVRAVNDARCQPPLAIDEVERIVDSISSREARRHLEQRP